MAGLLGALFAGVESKAQVLDQLPGFLMHSPAKSGQTVNYMTALQVTAVLACAQVLCNGLAQVPFRVMKARPGGRGADRAPEHPVYKLLNRKPNFFQTSFEFRRTIGLHLVLTGNAFVYISRGAGGRILELIPLQPSSVSVTQRADLSLTYQLSSLNGEAAPAGTLTAREIWHIRGLSWNGWMGLEPVSLAREAIGLGMALEEAHSRLHANGAHPSGTWAVDGKLSDDQHAKLTAWIKKHAAGENRGAPLVLDNAAKWMAQQMSGVDPQYIQTRQFQVLEVCRALNVQPMLVFAVERPTYASAEQLANMHVIHSLAPLYELVEQSADVFLLEVEDDTGFFCALDPRGLMRGSMKDQAEYYAKALGSGGSRPWMTQDEVRDETDLVPKGGDADELLEPVGATPPATDDDEPNPADDRD